MLASLCGRDYTAAEKAAAVARFKQKTGERYDGLVMKAADAERELDGTEPEPGRAAPDHRGL